MPWSDWVQSPLDYWQRGPLAYVDTSSSGSTVDDYPGKMDVQIDAARQQAKDGTALRSQRFSPNIQNDIVVSQQDFGRSDTDPSKMLSAVTLDARIAWHGLEEGAVRPSWPDELRAMEEGVDYAIRPDRDGSEFDSYIEYEDGQVYVQPDDMQGWDGTITLTVARADVSSTTNPDGWDQITARARAYLPVDPTINGWPYDYSNTTGATSVPEGDYLATPIWPEYGAGYTFASVDGPLGASESGSFSLDSTIKRFCWVAASSVNTFGYSGQIWNNSTEIDYDIKLKVLFPRWRYWIPDRDIPLRQRQRDDGLGSSTRRARGGTSRQRSIRQRGYL